jgi:hypothetical protein
MPTTSAQGGAVFRIGFKQATAEAVEQAPSAMAV